MDPNHIQDIIDSLYDEEKVNPAKVLAYFTNQRKAIERKLFEEFLEQGLLAEQSYQEKCFEIVNSLLERKFYRISYFPKKKNVTKEYGRIKEIIHRFQLQEYIQDKDYQFSQMSQIVSLFPQKYLQTDFYLFLEDLAEELFIHNKLSLIVQLKTYCAVPQKIESLISKINRRKT